MEKAIDMTYFKEILKGSDFNHLPCEKLNIKLNFSSNYPKENGEYLCLVLEDGFPKFYLLIFNDFKWLHSKNIIVIFYSPLYNEETYLIINELRNIYFSKLEEYINNYEDFLNFVKEEKIKILEEELKKLKE